MSYFIHSMAHGLRTVGRTRTSLAGRVEADHLGEPFTIGTLLLVQILGPADPLSTGTLYILDDGSEAAIVRMQGESPDLWIVDRFSGDGGLRRCALARRRWHPRAAIDSIIPTVQLSLAQRGHFFPCPPFPLLVAVIGSPCPYCGQTMQLPDRPPSRDHIKPRSKGHALAGNLALVCCRCNTDKGSRSLGQWLTRLSRAGDPRADHVVAFMRTRGMEIELLKHLSKETATAEQERAARETPQTAL